MRRLTLFAILAASLLPSTAQAETILQRLGFHRCYFQIPARPELVNTARLVIVQPGYWETDLRPSAYVPIDGRDGYDSFYHRRPRHDGQPETGPRADRTARVWHEPIYMKVIEPVVVDPGHAILLRADNCWPNS